MIMAPPTSVSRSPTLDLQSPVIPLTPVLLEHLYRSLDALAGCSVPPRRSLATGVSVATAEGDVDLSYLASDGVFTAWEDHTFFFGAFIGPSEASVGARESICAQTTCACASLAQAPCVDA